VDNHIAINGRRIGPGAPVYIIAEMSANHGQSFADAVKIIDAAKQAGADAVKLQTYTPDTLTIDCANRYFTIDGTLWHGRKLYDLYGEAFTPWEWQPKLKQHAEAIGIELFSTPFDASAVEFLENMNVAAHKIASFENIDTGLLRTVAKTGKPVIASTGMASLAEIDELVRTLREGGAGQMALLKCTSAYPAAPEEMNLRTIPHLAAAFGVPVGLSDHTLGDAVAVAAVSLGACIVEKHFTLCRVAGGPDSAFSLEPDEFKRMVNAIRIAERALGGVHYGVSAAETPSQIFRRSLFVVKDMGAGEVFSTDNLRSIRPGYGLHPRHLDDVLGRVATAAIARGTPLAWPLIGGGDARTGAPPDLIKVIPCAPLERDDCEVSFDR
jgi:N-acetylneuraminate synthase